MASYLKPKAWKVVKASNGVTFVECKGVRFSFMFDDGEANALAALLSRKDREIAKLKHQLREARDTP